MLSNEGILGSIKNAFVQMFETDKKHEKALPNENEPVDDSARDSSNGSTTEGHESNTNFRKGPQENQSEGLIAGLVSSVKQALSNAFVDEEREEEHDAEELESRMRSSAEHLGNHTNENEKRSQAREEGKNSFSGYLMTIDEIY